MANSMFIPAIILEMDSCGGKLAQLAHVICHNECNSWHCWVSQWGFIKERHPSMESCFIMAYTNNMDRQPIERCHIEAVGIPTVEIRWFQDSTMEIQWLQERNHNFVHATTAKLSCHEQNYRSSITTIWYPHLDNLYLPDIIILNQHCFIAERHTFYWNIDIGTKWQYFNGKISRHYFAFFWGKMYEFKLRLHWGLFLWVQYTISIGSDDLLLIRRQAIPWTSNYPVHWHIPQGLNDLIPTLWNSHCGNKMAVAGNW